VAPRTARSIQGRFARVPDGKLATEALRQRAAAAVLASVPSARGKKQHTVAATKPSGRRRKRARWYVPTAWPLRNTPARVAALPFEALRLPLCFEHHTGSLCSPEPQRQRKTGSVYARHVTRGTRNDRTQQYRTLTSDSGDGTASGAPRPPPAHAREARPARPPAAAGKPRALPRRW